MIRRRLQRLLYLIVLLTPGLRAQVPAVPEKTPAVSEESRKDPLGRSTPRGTVEGFITAADAKDYERAASYLDTQLQGDSAREVAQQLQAILNRDAFVDLHSLSAKPEGNLLDNRNPDRDLVGVAKTSSGSVVLWVERVQHGSNPPIWLFSQDTVQRVPEIYQYVLSGPEIERKLPGWLNAKLLSRPLWLWCIVLISIPLVLVLGSLFSRLLKPILTAVANRFVGTTEIDSVQGLVGPLRLVLLGILVLIASNYAYTLLRRHFWADVGNFLIIFGATLLLTRAVGIASNLYLAKLRRTRALEKIALAGLLGRVLKIAILITGVLTVGYLAGLKLTAALTSLGIGGLALAFASQKTLENLFGGITIISDRPMRIGDVCKIGDVFGMVKDIGLRSTRIRTFDRTIVTIPNAQLATMNLENFTLRDKFWFHPTISLRHDTTIDQMETALLKIRDLLEKDSRVESGTARVSFIGIGNASQNVEVFAYVFAADYEGFLAVQEQLLLRILELVELTGTGLALPLQRTYIVRDSVPSELEQKAKTAAASDD